MTSGPDWPTVAGGTCGEPTDRRDGQLVIAAEGSRVSAWNPGQPVVTAQDHADWRSWRSERKRLQQRERRALHPRIDYYPDNGADAVIRSMSGRYVGGDFSSVINRIVLEWIEHRHRNKDR